MSFVVYDYSLIHYIIHFVNKKLCNNLILYMKIKLHTKLSLQLWAKNSAECNSFFIVKISVQKTTLTSHIQHTLIFSNNINKLQVKNLIF